MQHLLTAHDAQLLNTNPRWDGHWHVPDVDFFNNMHAELKGDREFMLKMMEGTGFILELAAPPLRSDREVYIKFAFCCLFSSSVFVVGLIPERNELHFGCK